MIKKIIFLILFLLLIICYFSTIQFTATVKNGFITGLVDILNKQYVLFGTCLFLLLLLILMVISEYITF